MKNIQISVLRVARPPVQLFSRISKPPYFITIFPPNFFCNITTPGFLKKKNIFLTSSSWKTHQQIPSPTKTAQPGDQPPTKTAQPGDQNKLKTAQPGHQTNSKLPDRATKTNPKLPDRATKTKSSTRQKLNCN